MKARSVGPLCVCKAESLRICVIFQHFWFNLCICRSMPLNCCVPQCTFKGYRNAGGDKVSFFNFPKDPNLRKSWIHAIRRDPGKDFQLTGRRRFAQGISRRQT